VTQTDPVLVLNSGSSSVKFALLDPVRGERALDGLAERLGTRDATLQIRRHPPEPAGETTGESLPSGATHRDVVARILDRLGDPPLAGAGHRVVHGGERFTESVLVDDDVIDDIRSFIPLAPLQNPANLAGIEAVRAIRPGLPQVAVFDTAFHQTMPPSAYRYAVPGEWYERHGVRRYGFHGISYRYVSARAAELLGRPLRDLRLVIAHLGNGCSAVAVRDGVSVDTTMGLTPLEGLVMGSRSGDVDPGLFGYLAAKAGLTVEAVTDQLNTRSGLLALSGVGNDMRAVQDAAEQGHEQARLALDVFVHRLAKAIAGLVTSLDHLDALVFTAGIGENSPIVRAAVLARLGFLGLTEDPPANANHGRSTNGRITTLPAAAPPPTLPAARPAPAQALVIPTDEELMIARDTARLVAPAS
jgi:acetate kinase